MSVTIATLGERSLRRLGVAIVPVADRPAITAAVTADTIATAALVELGVIASDETPSTADQALAVSKVGAVHAALVAQGIVSWPSSAIPQAVSEEMTKLTANIMASSFGKPADAQLHTMLEARVRKVALVLTAPDLASDAVLSVHKDFAARGMVRWSVFDLPDEVSDAYTLAAAYQLAPLFDLKANPADAVAAERAIARYIALPTSGERVRADFF